MTIDEEGDPQDSEGSDSESSTEDVVDIDYWDADDPRAVSEYVEEIYDYLRKREVRRSSRFNKLTQIIPLKNGLGMHNTRVAQRCSSIIIP
jgi:capsid portal protein